jgi:HSP20 family protein
MLVRWRDSSALPALPNMFDDLFNNDLTSFFGRDMSDFFSRNQNMIMPAVNVKETPDHYEIEVAAPGLRKEDFNIRLDQNILTLSAQRESRSGFEPNTQSQVNVQGQEPNASAAPENQTSTAAPANDQGGNQNTALSHQGDSKSAALQGASQNQPQRYTRREFSYTTFQRSFILPDSTDPERISANYQDGILLIRVPKREQAQNNQTRTIDIS